MSRCKDLVEKYCSLSESDPTEKQLSNLTSGWSKLAGEKVTIEWIKGTYYGYCSELGCLKLEHDYNNRPKAEASYSKPKKTWFFRLEA